MNAVVKKVLIELDCLLDTRIACVGILSDEHAATLLEKGYFERQSDEFWKMVPIDEKAYKALYKNRGDDPRVLEKSYITYFTAHSFHAMIKGLIDENLNTPHSSAFVIVINEYPHRLTPAEQDVFKMSLFRTVGLEFNIQFVRYDLDTLTPSFVSSNYAMMLMYDYEQFIRIHGEAMCKLPIREVKLYAPALFGVKVPTMDEMKEMMERQVDPFSEVRLLASPMIDLEFIHVSNLSVFDIRTYIEEGELSVGERMLAGMVDAKTAFDPLAP